jgi:hypothetical protein
MRIPVHLINQRGKIPIGRSRLICLPFERRALPEQPPLARFAIKPHFRDTVLHPSSRIVPHRPYFDNEHVVSLNAIFGAHLVASMGRRAPNAKPLDDGLDTLQLNFRESHPSPSRYGRRSDSPSLSSMVPTLGIANCRDLAIGHGPDYMAPVSLIPTAIVHWEPDAPVTEARVTLFQTSAEAMFAFGQLCHHSSSPLFPYFTGVHRTEYCYGPRLQADKTPLQKPWYDSTESSHQCTHLSLLDWDAKSELRARSLLCDEIAFDDRVRECFVADGSTLDRLRASNRRKGIASSQELFIGEWLFTTWSYDNKQAEDRFLTIERFRGDVRLLTETVARHKSVCVREADNQWCIVTEYGKKDVVVLECLADTEVRRFAGKFAVTLTSRIAGGVPEEDVSR